MTRRTLWPLLFLLLLSLPARAQCDEAVVAIERARAERDTPVLLDALTSESAALRARAARALASVQTPEAFEQLLERAMTDPDASVRAEAAFAFGQIDTAAVDLYELVMRLDEEPERSVRRELLYAIGQLGDRATLLNLVSERPDEEDRALFSRAYSRMGLRGITSWRTVRGMLSELEAPQPQRRWEAAYFFARTRTELTDGNRFRLTMSLDELADDDPAVAYLLRALAQAPEEANVAEYIFTDWLERGTDWRIRVEALRALGSVDSLTLYHPQLLDALDDPSHHVRLSAAQRLAETDWSAALTDDLVPRLEQLGDRPAATLLGGLFRTDADLARATLDRWRTERPDAFRYALAQLPATQRDLLAEIVSAGDSRLAQAAAARLAALWRSERAESSASWYADAFGDALGTLDMGVIYAAAPALTDSLFRPHGAREVLEETFRKLTMPRDLEAATQIVDALGTIGEAASLPLLRLATDADIFVLRTHAADAIEAITGERTPVELDAPAADFDAAAVCGALGDEMQLVLHTDRGEIVLELFGAEAPMTTARIARYAREGRYDGVPFHRVVSNFVVQGGDFVRGDGFGSPEETLPSEFTRHRYERGTLGMASAGKDTEGSQFFITHSPQPHLDGRYTVFGQVVRGQEVVDALRQDDLVVRAEVR